MLRRIPPRRLILSSGGIRVVAQAGALMALEEAGMLRSIKEYIGTSGGALISLAPAIGYSVKTLKTFSSRFDFSEIRSLEPESMLELFSTYGLDTGERLKKLIVSLLRQKGLSQDITFAEIPSLRIFASDLNTCKVHEYSAKKTPRNSVVLGVLASTSIPIYFTPVKDPETGHLMVDGAVHNGLALAFLSEEEAASSISIRFSNTRIENDKIDGFMQFLGQIFRCVISNRTFEKHKGRVIHISCGEYPMWNFEATEEEKEKLIRIGYECTKKFLETDEVVSGIRRNSL